MYICTHEIIRLIIIKMKMKIKNRSQIYNINRLRPRNGHKYSKHKTCFNMMMLLCIKHHLSNIWSNTEGELKKALLIKKKRVECWRSDVLLNFTHVEGFSGKYRFYKTLQLCPNLSGNFHQSGCLNMKFICQNENIKSTTYQCSKQRLFKVFNNS